MLLKKLGENDILTNSNEYIKKNNEQLEDIDEVMNINPSPLEEEEDHDFIGTSVSLFDE